jgi:hypothetical protein
MAEFLWNDAEKRRKNAWLVTRLRVYACIFGAMVALMPESEMDGYPLSRFRNSLSVMFS